jgi:hypothetical protein
VVLSAKKSARKAKMIRSHPSNISEKRKFAWKDEKKSTFEFQFVHWNTIQCTRTRIYTYMCIYIGFTSESRSNDNCWEKSTK